MTDEQRKDAAYIRQKMQADQAGCANSCGVMSQSANPVKHTLRTRVSLQRSDAEVNARLSEGLRELEYLLDKHPEVSRILDLLELVKP